MRLRGNQSTARALNRRLVLDQLRRNGSMSRAEITAAIGLSAAAISFITAQLIDEGILIEGEAVQGAGGRRPIPLKINYASRHSIGLKVMVDRVIGVITDLETAVLAETELPILDTDPASVALVCARVARLLVAEAGSAWDRVIGVGVAISGQVDAEAGVCIQMQRFKWRDVPLAAMLVDSLAVPVWLDNDANAFAVSQHLFGHGRGTQDLAAIAVGRGIGAGLVISGRLHRGASGAAGEFGHNFEAAGRICECGREGCLETRCADSGLLASWAERDPLAAGKGMDDLVAAAAAGDRIVRDIVADAGTRLGRHVGALVNLVDPEMIVFGGEGVRLGRFLYDPLRRVLDQVCYPGTPRVAIDWEGTGWPRGAAALAIQHFFNFEVTGGYIAQSPELRAVERVA